MICLLGELKQSHQKGHPSHVIVMKLLTCLKCMVKDITIGYLLRLDWGIQLIGFCCPMAKLRCSGVREWHYLCWLISQSVNEWPSIQILKVSFRGLFRASLRTLLWPSSFFIHTHNLLKVLTNLTSSYKLTIHHSVVVSWFH